MAGSRRFGFHSGVVFARGINYRNAGVTSEQPLILAGNSSTRIQSTDPNTNFLQIYAENSAVSGDNRGMYLRQYLSGAGSGGEAARIFSTVLDVAAGTVHGAHISLNFNDTGSVTGQGIACRNTLHIPDAAAWAPGTIAALQAEIWSDGADSDTDGATEVSFIRVINGGHADGIADVDDDAFLMSISGGAIGAGNMVQADVDETKFSHKIKCNVHGTTMYLMLADS